MIKTDKWRDVGMLSLCSIPKRVNGKLLVECSPWWGQDRRKFAQCRQLHLDFHHFFRGRQHLLRWWTCLRLGTLTVPSAISMASSRCKTYFIPGKRERRRWEKEKFEKIEETETRYQKMEKKRQKCGIKGSQKINPSVHELTACILRWLSTRNLPSQSRPREGEGTYFNLDFMFNLVSEFWAKFMLM